jgi:hypothetical protein
MRPSRPSRLIRAVFSYLYGEPIRQGNRAIFFYLLGLAIVVFWTQYTLNTAQGLADTAKTSFYAGGWERAAELYAEAAQARDRVFPWESELSKEWRRKALITREALKKHGSVEKSAEEDIAALVESVDLDSKPRDQKPSGGEAGEWWERLDRQSAGSGEKRAEYAAAAAPKTEKKAGYIAPDAIPPKAAVPSSWSALHEVSRAALNYAFYAIVAALVVAGFGMVSKLSAEILFFSKAPAEDEPPPAATKEAPKKKGKKGKQEDWEQPQQQQQQQQKPAKQKQKKPPKPPAKPAQEKEEEEPEQEEPVVEEFNELDHDDGQDEQDDDEPPMVHIKDDYVFDSFMCPLTGKIMVDPVICMDGVTYERSAITEYFARLKKGKKIISPVTGERMDSTDILPNTAVRTLIKEMNNNNKP